MDVGGAVDVAATVEKNIVPMEVNTSGCTAIVRTSVFTVAPVLRDINQIPYPSTVRESTRGTVLDGVGQRGWMLKVK